MNNLRLIYGLSSLLSLAIGMGIYFFFRDTNMLLFAWIPQLEFLNSVYIPLKHSVFTSMLLFNLPDALWFLSGILFLRFIWFYRFKEQTVYVISFYFMGAIFEISQLSDNIPGTFDYLDLLFMGIAAFVEGLLYNFFVRRR
jgi:hypothetical protein